MNHEHTGRGSRLLHIFTPVTTSHPDLPIHLSYFPFILSLFPGIPQSVPSLNLTLYSNLSQGDKPHVRF
jgi:hypothetical protein